MKLLVVYNTCNIGGTGNIPYYVDAIRSFLYQRVNPEHQVKVCLSACMPSQMWIPESQNFLADQWLSFLCSPLE